MSTKARKKVNAAMRERRKLKQTNPTLAEQQRMARLERQLFGDGAPQIRFGSVASRDAK